MHISKKNRSIAFYQAIILAGFIITILACASNKGLVNSRNDESSSDGDRAAVERNDSVGTPSAAYDLAYQK